MGESVLSPNHVGPGAKLRLPGLLASVFTHWVISLPPSPTPELLSGFLSCELICYVVLL